MWPVSPPCSHFGSSMFAPTVDNINNLPSPSSTIPTPPPTIHSFDGRSRESHINSSSPPEQLLPSQVQQTSYCPPCQQPLFAPNNALRLYTHRPPPLALQSILNCPGTMPIVLKLKPGADGEVKLVGACDTDKQAPNVAPLTPPSTDGKTDEEGVEDGGVDGLAMLVAAGMRAAEADASVALLLAACMESDCPGLFADCYKDDASPCGKRAREEAEEEEGEGEDKGAAEEVDDDVKDADAHVSKKARIQANQGRSVWSADETESAFVTAQLYIPPINPRTKLVVFGRQLGRNQLIGIVVSLATGLLHDRKVISSHGQTVRAKTSKGGYPPILFDILRGTAPKRDIKTLEGWELSGEIKDLIGMPRNISSLGNDWSIPLVRYLDELKGIDKMVPPGMDKEKAELFEE